MDVPRNPEIEEILSSMTEQEGRAYLIIQGGSSDSTFGWLESDVISLRGRMYVYGEKGGWYDLLAALESLFNK